MRSRRPSRVLWSLAVALGCTVSLACSSPQPGEPVRITVPPGVPFGTVLDTLVDRSIVSGPLWFGAVREAQGGGPRDPVG